MIELIDKLDWLNLILSSVVVTVLASALHTYFPKFFEKASIKKWNVVIIASLITFLNLVGFVKEHEIIVADYIVKFLFTWSFSLLFYSILGTWFIDKFFESIKKKFDK